MPFRETFNCLWCGRPHTTRATDDLEGWAQLCPDCLGRAGDNPFLRFRLKTALQERARGSTATVQPAAAARAVAQPDPGLDREMIEYYAARAPEYDDWYLRRGRYNHGPVHDMAWQVELDSATGWLDSLPIRGEIVELAAGTGWWSPLLAQKGELWSYDASEAPLELARRRLVAHGLRAHLHVRDAWAEPDRQVQAVFAGFWLSHVPRDRFAAFLSLARRWLLPGGTFAFIDSKADPTSGAVDQPARAETDMPDVIRRRLADGREFRVVKVFHEPALLEAELRAAGFTDVEVRSTGRFFILGRARAGGAPREAMDSAASVPA